MFSSLRDARIPAGLWALLAVTLTMPFWSLGHPLWEVDDARYAEVPREMAELRDWVTPRLNYVDYVQKPPLIYWMDAASYSVLGVSEASARLSLAVLSIAAIAGVVWLGWWLFSPLVGVYAGIILGTGAEFSLLSHLKTPDTAVAAFLLWTQAFLLRGLHRPRDAGWAGAGAGLCAALAFLSKGLIAFLFPTLWLSAVAALFPETRKGLKSLLTSWGIPLCLLIVGGWVWIMTSRNPRFPYHFFIEQHFLRYLTPHYDRGGPWYYFLGVDLAALLPWTLLAVAATILPAAHWRNSDPRIRQLVIWIVAILAFFSVSKSKLPTYLLPVIPQQCLLAAELLHRLEAEVSLRAWFRTWGPRLAALTWAIVPIALVLRGRVATPPIVTPNILWTGAAVFLALGAGFFAMALPPGSHGIKIAGRAALAGFAVTALLLGGANEAQSYLSAKDVSAAIASYCRPEDSVMTYGTYLHGIPFYTRRPVDAVIHWVGELDYAKEDPRFRHRFGDDDMIRALPQPGKAACVVLRARDESYFNSLAQPGKVRRMERFGDWILEVF